MNNAPKKWVQFISKNTNNDRMKVCEAANLLRSKTSDDKIPLFVEFHLIHMSNLQGKIIVLNKPLSEV